MQYYQEITRPMIQYCNPLIRWPGMNMIVFDKIA